MQQGIWPTGPAQMSRSKNLSKSRLPDFSSEEIRIIKRMYLDYHHILATKHNTEETQRQKNQIYQELVQKVNAVGGLNRSLKNIKDKWQNICRHARRKAFQAQHVHHQHHRQQQQQRKQQQKQQQQHWMMRNAANIVHGDNAAVSGLGLLLPGGDCKGVGVQRIGLVLSQPVVASSLLHESKVEASIFPQAQAVVPGAASHPVDNISTTHPPPPPALHQPESGESVPVPMVDLTEPASEPSTSTLARYSVHQARSATSSLASSGHHQHEGGDRGQTSEMEEEEEEEEEGGEEEEGVEEVVAGATASIPINTDEYRKAMLEIEWKKLEETMRMNRVLEDYYKAKTRYYNSLADG